MCDSHGHCQSLPVTRKPALTRRDARRPGATKSRGRQFDSPRSTHFEAHMPNSGPEFAPTVAWAREAGRALRQGQVSAERLIPVPIYSANGVRDVLTTPHPDGTPAGRPDPDRARRARGDEPVGSLGVRVGTSIPLGRHARADPRRGRSRAAHAPRPARHAHLIHRRSGGDAARRAARRPARTRTLTSRTTPDQCLSSTPARSSVC